MIRWALLLLLLAGVSSAQQGPTAAPKAPTEVAQWRAYATLLESDLREKLRATALCTATNDGLRAELDRLQKRVAELEKPAPK